MGEGESESCWETVDLLSRLSSFLSILKLCTAVLILMANIILIVVILRCPRLRRQRFHMFIISLALADILVGLIMPLMTLALKEQMWPFGSTLCQVFTSVQKISLAASFFNFLGISVDRLFAVKKPFAYRQEVHIIVVIFVQQEVAAEALNNPPASAALLAACSAPSNPHVDRPHKILHRRRRQPQLRLQISLQICERGLKTLAREPFAVSECVDLVEQCRCFHPSNNSHPGWWIPHCAPLC